MLQLSVWYRATFPQISKLDKTPGTSNAVPPSSLITSSQPLSLAHTSARTHEQSFRFAFFFQQTSKTTELLRGFSFLPSFKIRFLPFFSTHDARKGKSKRNSGSKFKQKDGFFAVVAVHRCTKSLLSAQISGSTLTGPPFGHQRFGRVRDGGVLPRAPRDDSFLFSFQNSALGKVQRKSEPVLADTGKLCTHRKAIADAGR